MSAAWSSFSPGKGIYLVLRPWVFQYDRRGLEYSETWERLLYSEWWPLEVGSQSNRPRQRFCYFIEKNCSNPNQICSLMLSRGVLMCRVQFHNSQNIVCDVVAPRTEISQCCRCRKNLGTNVQPSRFHLPSQRSIKISNMSPRTGQVHHHKKAMTSKKQLPQ